jgi:hypothetical protein
MMSSMKGTCMHEHESSIQTQALAELILCRMPKPLSDSDHEFEYWLGYVLNMICVVNYDNEVRKGDHRHLMPQCASWYICALAFLKLNSLINPITVKMLDFKNGI